MLSLLFNVSVSRPANAAVSGTTDINGTAVDMTDWDGVLFIAALGALTATQVTTLKARGGAQSDGSDAVDLVGAVTDAALDAHSNKLLLLDVVRPPGVRYIRPVLGRGVAGAALDSIVAVRYRGRKEPVSQGTDVSAAIVSVSPQASDSALTSTTVTPSGTTTKLNTTARTSG